jgi:hypothetical protein
MEKLRRLICVSDYLSVDDLSIDTYTAVFCGILWISIREWFFLIIALVICDIDDMANNILTRTRDKNILLQLDANMRFSLKETQKTDFEKSDRRLTLR